MCIGIVSPENSGGVTVPSGNSFDNGPNKLTNAITANVPINVTNAFLSVIILRSMK